MIQFNKLRINPEGTKLIIEASIKNLEYYTNVYLDTIQIDTQNTFIENGPSSNTVYTKVIKGNTKSISLELGEEDLLPSLTENLFFVYIKAKGIPAANTPCGGDNLLCLGTAFYLTNIYCNLLKTLQLEEGIPCKTPKAFINEFLKYKGLQLSLLTGNSLNAIKYFNNLTSGLQVTKNNSKCGCHEV